MFSTYTLSAYAAEVGMAPFGVAQNPILSFTNMDPSDNQFLRYYLSITNWNSYPPELFEAVAGRTSCVSRTHVDIYDASTDKRIYGFCALGSPKDLTKLWFAIPIDKTPPNSVYVIFDDTVLNTKIKSNSVSLNVVSPQDDPDNDGIVGTADQCPNQAEDFNGYQDSDGCPEGGNPVDKTPPKIVVKGDVTRQTSNPDGMIVHFSSTANDDIDGAVPVYCSPSSGSMLPIGKTTIYCEASDKSGNKQTGSFIVTIDLTKQSSIATDKTIYTSDNLSPIAIQVSGDITEHDRLNPYVELQLVGPDQTILQSTGVPVGSGSFTKLLILSVDENTPSGSYMIKAKYKDQNITPVEFALIITPIDNGSRNGEPKITLSLEPDFVTVEAGKTTQTKASLAFYGVMEENVLLSCKIKPVSASANTITCMPTPKQLQLDSNDNEKDSTIIIRTDVATIPQDYTVTITAENDNIKIPSHDFFLEVVQVKPEVSIGISGNTEPGSQITFTSHVNNDPSGIIKKYEWDFGDDKDNVTSDINSVNHIYDNKGTYQVLVDALSVDSSGTYKKVASAITSVDIVEPQPPWWIAIIGAVAGIIGGLAKFMSSRKSKKPAPKKEPSWD